MVDKTDQLLHIIMRCFHLCRLLQKKKIVAVTVKTCRCHFSYADKYAESDTIFLNIVTTINIFSHNAASCLE